MPVRPSTRHIFADTQESFIHQKIFLRTAIALGVLLNSDILPVIALTSSILPNMNITLTVPTENTK